MIRALTVFSAVLLATGAAMANESVTTAFFGGDHNALDRAARRAGARGLAPALNGADRRAQRAAIAGSPLPADAWTLLPALGDLSLSPDRSIAAPAARAAAEIAGRLNRDRALELDIPYDQLARIVDGFRSVALDTERWADVRVHALDAATHAARALGPGHATRPFDLDSMLADREPEVRRAVMELTEPPLSAQTRDKLIERIVADSDPTVAAVAGQVVCADHVDRKASAAIDRAMTSEATARLRTLVANASISAEVRVEGARCLARDGGKESKQAIRALSATAPSYLRASLRSMTKARKR